MEAQEIYRIVFKDYPDLMNVKDVSGLLEVSTKTVYALIKAGKLHSTKVGREFRVPKYELLRYLEIINSDGNKLPYTLDSTTVLR